MTAVEDARAALADYDDWHLTRPWIEEMQGLIAYENASHLASALRALIEPPTEDEREALLRILSGLDYEGGGMMRWHPSGEPNEAAHRTAESILTAGFRRQGPVTEAETTAADVAYVIALQTDPRPWFAMRAALEAARGASQ